MYSDDWKFILLGIKEEKPDDFDTRSLQFPIYNLPDGLKASFAVVYESKEF